LPAELDDGTLEARLFAAAEPKRERIAPDPARIHQELERTGVTLERDTAGVVDARSSVLARQTKQGVDATHAGPRQEIVEQRRGEASHGVAEVGGLAAQEGQVTVSLGALVFGEVVGVGRALAPSEKV
jgi:hypothetical protein